MGKPRPFSFFILHFHFHFHSTTLLCVTTLPSLIPEGLAAHICNIVSSLLFDGDCFHFHTGTDACLKCDPNSVCLSDEAGYSCLCKLGYAGNGQLCKGKVYACNLVKYFTKVKCQLRIRLHCFTCITYCTYTSLFQSRELLQCLRSDPAFSRTRVVASVTFLGLYRVPIGIILSLFRPVRIE